MYNKEGYYTSKQIRSRHPDANAYMIFGERSNGKSYDNKEIVLKQAIDVQMIDTDDVLEKEKGRFVYLRRFEDEIRFNKIAKYYSGKVGRARTMRLTDNEYDDIKPVRGELYLSNGPDIDAHKKIGYYMCLENEQDYAGAALEDVDNIVFEEFISRSRYLDREPSKLMNLFSTIARRRDIKLWLLGNTISKVVPYFTDWGIYDYIKQMPQGTIKAFYIPIPDKKGQYPYGKETQERVHPKRREHYFKLAVEYCAPSPLMNQLIGEHADSLNSGTWQTDKQPKLEKGYNYKNDKLIYRIVFDVKERKYLAEYRANGKSRYWFIYPKKTEIKNKSRVISDIVKRDIRYTTSLQSRTEKERILFSEFNTSNVFYANDDIGTEFKQLALNYLKLKL